MQNHITTERLTLDPLTSDDHEFVIKLVNSKGWLQFIGDRNVHSYEDAINYINKINNTPNLTYWVVKTKDQNLPVGIISFLKRSYLDHFDIGFAFLPEYHGKGYAYEAAKEVLSIAENEYDPILATTIPQNVSSIKLLTRLGFHFDKEIEFEKKTLHVYCNVS